MAVLDSIQRTLLATTGVLPELERQRTLNQLADMRNDRTLRYGVYTRYYDGDTAAKLTGRLKTYLEQEGFGYTENFCLPTGSPVVTPSGLRAIEDFIEGDLVLGHDGLPHRVLRRMRRAVHEPIVRLRTFGSPVLRMTDEHPVLVTRQSELAGVTSKYATTDHFRCYGLRPNMAYRRDTVPRRWVPAGDVEVGDIAWSTVPAASGADAMDPDFLRLLGWYLAEGSVSATGRLAFSFHSAEIDYQDEVAELLAGVGARRVARCHPSPNATQVVTYSKELCAWLSDLGGCGAAGKRIAPEVMAQTDLLPLLSAAWKGDGTTASGKVSSLAYTTVSADLAEQIQTVMLRCGLVPSRGVKLGRDRLPAYYLNVAGESARRLAALLGGDILPTAWDKAPSGVLLDGQIGYVVAEAGREHYEGLVHNIEVADVNSYLLPGCTAVHNCETIVDALADCLELTGITATDDRVAEWIRRVWKANRFDELQGIVHTQVPVKGDGYIIVDWDEATALPRFTWNHPEVIRPVYDEHGRLLVAAKAWDEAREAKTNPNGHPVRRLNLYFPGRVEKWFTTTAAGARAGDPQAVWQPHEDYGDPAWPVPWLDRSGEPLGCAVLHFRNKAKGNDHGRSELHNVIPQQNFLTKALVDLADVLDYQGAAQRYATGVKGGNYKSAAGTVWETENPDARFGQFDPANPKGALEAIEQTLRRMAARSQTPLHQLMTGGQNPSGETLRAARAPLVAKAEDRLTSYGGVWVAGHYLAVKLQALHDRSFRPPDDLELDAAWKPAETADEKGDLEAAEAKHRLGVSKRTLLRELGYDPDEEAEHRETEAQAASEAMVAAFNRGAGAPGFNGSGG